MKDEDLNHLDEDDAEEIIAAKKGIQLHKHLKEMTKEEKVAYVKEQGQTRNHHCHWPGCEKQVPPAMWGCYKHWMKLPKSLRDKVWAAYKPGQEATMTPSVEYVKVVREIQQWIKEHYPEG